LFFTRLLLAQRYPQSKESTAPLPLFGPKRGDKSEKKDTGLQGGLKLRLAPNLAKSEVSEFHSIFLFVADIFLFGRVLLKKIVTSLSLGGLAINRA
jgi:hypothetical protein